MEPAPQGRNRRRGGGRRRRATRTALRAGGPLAAAVVALGALAASSGETDDRRTAAIAACAARHGGPVLTHLPRPFWASTTAPLDEVTEEMRVGMPRAALPYYTTYDLGQGRSGELLGGFMAYGDDRRHADAYLATLDREARAVRDNRVWTATAAGRRVTLVAFARNAHSIGGVDITGRLGCGVLSFTADDEAQARRWWTLLTTPPAGGSR
jgi:hypothetical protein